MMFWTPTGTKRFERPAECEVTGQVLWIQSEAAIPESRSQNTRINWGSADGEPQMSFGEPQVSFGEPQVSVGEPQVSFGEPQMFVGEPQMPRFKFLRCQPRLKVVLRTLLK